MPATPNADRMRDRSGGSFRKWRKLCRFRDQYSREKCHLCKQPIDYSIPPNNTNLRPYNGAAYEPDHIMPVSTHPQLAYAVENGAPSHASCNRSRQDDAVPTENSWVTAEDW